MRYEKLKFLFIFWVFVLNSCRSPKSISSAQSSAQKLNTQAEALYNAATKARMSNNLKEADTLYKQCIELAPNHAAAYYYLAKIQHASSKSKEALLSIRKAHLLNPENIYYKELLAEILYATNNTEEAVKLYQEFLTLVPAKKDMYWNSLLRHYKMNNLPQKALQLIDDKEKLVGKREDLDARRREVLLLSMNEKEALTYFKNYISERKTTKNDQVLLIELLDRNSLYKERDQAVQELALKYSTDADLFPFLAQMYFRAKDTLSARNKVRQIVQSPAILSEKKIEMTSWAWSNKMISRDEYESMIQEIYNRDPREPITIEAYIDLLESQEKFQLIIPLARDLISYGHKPAQSWIILLNAYSRTKQSDSLYILAKKAAELFPQNTEIAQYQAYAAKITNNYAEAIDGYKRLLIKEKIRSKRVELYQELADCYFYSKQYILSDSAFENALAIDPENLNTQNNYAYFLSLRKQNLNRALELAENVMQSDSNDVYRDTYMWVLFQKNEYEKAYEQALKINFEKITSEEIADHIGDIYYKYGLKKEAITFWKKAQQLGKKSVILEKKIKEGTWYEEQY